jgi:hypothetical protein
MASFVELRKTRMVAGQEDDLRQLVRRYEHLAESTLDAPAAGGRRRVRAAVARPRSSRSCGRSSSRSARWSGLALLADLVVRRTATELTDDPAP